VLGDLLLKLGPIITPSALRSLGVRIDSVARACSFSIVEHHEDFTSVLRLRYLAYSAVNKAERDQPPSVMEDKHDKTAKIVIAKHGGRIVESLRVVAPEPGVPHEYEELTTIPAPFLDRELIAIMSRVCTHPGYRGSDLLGALVSKGDEIARSLGRRYGLGGCTDSLLRVYERFGWQSTGVQFHHATLKNIKEHLVYKDLMV
jgi:predicted GNAT family N-acyltransferase